MQVKFPVLLVSVWWFYL